MSAQIITNVFANAKTHTKAAKAAAKPDKQKVEIEGLSAYAALDAVEKAVKALKETDRAPINEQMLDHFVAEGLRIGRRPENFRGIEDATFHNPESDTDESGFESSASMELRARSTASALDEAAQGLLLANGIPVEEVEDRPETFIVNPAYANDAKVLEDVSKALSKIKGLPADFIMKQESTKKVVVAEGSLDAVFADRTRDPGLVRELLKVVGVLAVKPKLTATDIFSAIKIVGLRFYEKETDGE